MSGSIDPYKVLGISPDATYEEVRQAYRRAATKYHPDAGGDAWVFQQVQQAFDILRERFESDQTKSRHYKADDSRTNTSKPSTPNADPARTSDKRTKESRTQETRTPETRKPESRKPDTRRTPEPSRQVADEQGWSASADPTQRTSILDTVQRLVSGQNFQLRDETSYFVLANFMDLVMTGILLRFQAIEANPIADYIYQRYGFVGMVVLKIVSVGVVILLSQIIAQYNRTKGRLLLIAGTLVVAAVVVYSMFLARRLIHFE